VRLVTERLDACANTSDFGWPRMGLHHDKHLVSNPLPLE
jgi:hypothetical protein